MPQVLMKLGAALEKIGSQWFLIFTPAHVKFVLLKGNGLALFAQLSVQGLLDEYVVQSLYDNTIFLEVCGEHFMVFGL